MSGLEGGTLSVGWLSGESEKMSDLKKEPTEAERVRRLAEIGLAGLSAKGLAPAEEAWVCNNGGSDGNGGRETFCFSNNTGKSTVDGKEISAAKTWF